MAYNIDQFSKITGINKLLLRTWENRYSFLTPKRTNTKIRIYSDELLIQGLNAKLLLENGHKISQISKKNNKQIEELVFDIKDNISVDSCDEYFINQFIKSAIKYNSNLFNDTFNECLSNFQIIDFYKKIMLPTFSKVGLFWLSNKMNPAQEHFLSEMFKQKIYSQIDSVKQKNNNNKWLLFLPPNEYHELGLLFSRFILLHYGHDVIYLGSNVPYSSLSQVSGSLPIKNILFFSVSNFSKKNLVETTSFLNKEFSNCNIFLASDLEDGNLVEKQNKIKIVKSIDSFIDFISK